MFDPELKIGQILKNADVVATFKCGNMGGTRRSKTTNTLVIVSDQVNSLIHVELNRIMFYGSHALSCVAAMCFDAHIIIDKSVILTTTFYIFCGDGKGQIIPETAKIKEKTQMKV